jgi:methylmalonyl-CoA mutase C-terminal domain/subunit
MMAKNVKVLLAKAGRDGHTRGAMVVGNALRNAGMEVFFSGLYKTAPEIVEMALENNVDVIGLSSMDGTHSGPLQEITKILKGKGRDDILVIAGGVIHEEDIPDLKKSGVIEIFGPETSTDDIIEFIQDRVTNSS